MKDSGASAPRERRFTSPPLSKRGIQYSRGVSDELHCLWNIESPGKPAMTTCRCLKRKSAMCLPCVRRALIFARARRRDRHADIGIFVQLVA